jgi:hypothetical protein
MRSDVLREGVAAFHSRRLVAGEMVQEQSIAEAEQPHEDACAEGAKNTKECGLQ